MDARFECAAPVSYVGVCKWSTLFPCNLDLRARIISSLMLKVRGERVLMACRMRRNPRGVTEWIPFRLIKSFCMEALFRLIVICTQRMPALSIGLAGRRLQVC